MCTYVNIYVYMYLCIYLRTYYGMGGLLALKFK